MKKIKFISMGLVAAVMFFTAATKAGALNFPVTATVPAATGVSITATENHIAQGVEVFGPVVTEFDFDPLVFDSLFAIWRSNVFFAVNVAATGGAGAPDVTVTFGSPSSPPNQVKHIGFKSTATFTKVSGGPAPTDQTETELTAHGPTKLLSQLTGGEHINRTELIGGFLRIRVGIFDGNNPALNAAGGEPFTNGDWPGSYTGVFTVTGTVS